jgi:hypothetical protein
MKRKKNKEAGNEMEKKILKEEGKTRKHGKDNSRLQPLVT